VTTDHATPDPRRWQALALVCTAFFMTVLDIAIVNVALPSIGDDLHFSEENLQWVITAYALTFGGFLLLGGRAADLLGRRRIFMVGLTLFTIASLLCGLAWSESVLIGARGLQGLGAAIISPAALSIITTLFEEGPERNKALGVWGAVGGSGAAVGVLAGGVLTKYLGWEWIFWVNVPVGALALALTIPLVPESRIEVARRRYDVPGAVVITAALVVLVYAISKAPDVGWLTFRTMGLLALSIAMILAFLAWELRSKQPLVRLGIFRNRTLSAANAIAFLQSGTIFSNFFLLTLYVQRVLHYSALETGVTFVATAGTAVVVAGASQALVTRVGVKPVLIVGLLLLTFGMIWYTQLPEDGTYAADLLPGYLAVGFGIPLSYIPISIAALGGVKANEAGLASGILNTSQQIGGAIGIAAAATAASAHTDALLHDGKPPPFALTEGYNVGFWVCAAFVIASLIVTLAALPRRVRAPAEAEPARVPA
jgi:EmrB/QacA subfamily drug resistance transporter